MLNDLWSFNVKDGWKQIVGSNEIEYPNCFGHNMFYSNGNIYIFGGCDNNKSGNVLKDIYSFSLQSKNCSKVEVEGLSLKNTKN